MDRPGNYHSVRAWMAVAGAFFMIFCTVGFSNAFGVFQEHYRTLLKRSDSDISWIGSIGVAFAMLFGPLVGMITDKFGPTIPLYVGSVGLLFAIFMTSLGTQYYQIFLSQGVLLGLTTALLMNPTLSVVSRRVPHKRGLAMGLAVGGSSIGGVIWPIMLQELLYKRGVSFGWTMRIAAFVMILPLIIACLTIRNPPTPLSTPKTIPNPGQIHPLSGDMSGQETQDASGTDENKSEFNAAAARNSDKLQQEKKVDFSVIKQPAFMLLCLGLACTYLGLLTPLFYLSSYAIEQGTSPEMAFSLLSILNAASFFGRVIPGILADRYGHFNLCALSAFFSGIVAFCWTKATSLPGIIILSLAYGFASGGVMSLQNACGAKLAHAGNQGVAIGCVMGSIAVTALVGTPISGAILAASDYLGLSMYAGATLVTASIILLGARFCAAPKILAAF